MHSPVEFHEGLRRELVEIVSLRIMRCTLNPVTGAALGERAKEKLIQFYDGLTRLAVQKSYRFESTKYLRVIHHQTGEIRKSYAQITEACNARYATSWSEATVIRYTRILESLGLITRAHEEKLTCPGLQKVGRTTCHLYDFKTLMLNFDPLEEYYERMSIDGLLEAINHEPEYIPTPSDPGYLESIIVQSESNSQEFGHSLQNEIDPEKFDNQYSTNLELDNLERATPEEKILDAVRQPAAQNFIPSEKPAITPPLDDEWLVKVCIGGVDRDRVTRKISELPAKPKGQYYATWIAERAGLQWAPWILWDIDDKNSLDNARLLTKHLVKRLLEYGAPESTIRVIHTTRKGFHVYLDSRTVGLVPSKNLRLQIREFCLRLSPSVDKSLYTENRVIAVPNSKHRETSRFYAPVPLEMLSGPIEPIQELTIHQHDIAPRSEHEAPVTRLVEEFHRAMSIATPTGIPSFKKLQHVVSDPLPEFFGVGEGERDHAAFKLANYYKRRGLCKDETLVLCQLANSRNTPPLPDEEIRAKVERVYQLLKIHGR